MAVSAELGDRRTVTTPAGTIEYRERGRGSPVVFVHGVGVNGDLWRAVVPGLADENRCIAPDLPWGAHSYPLREDVDLSLPGMARIVADFIEVLGLDDVTIVANDTGGAVAQSLVGRYPERIGRLVLTSCDAFEKFPPLGETGAARQEGRNGATIIWTYGLGCVRRGSRARSKRGARAAPPE
jgi:pimeloyl-ACP methyl ester carboxylesterase